MSYVCVYMKVCYLSSKLKGVFMLNNIDVYNRSESSNIWMLTRMAARYMRGGAVLFFVLALVLSNSDAFAVNSSASTDAAVVVVDSDNLTATETATVDLLIGYGKDPVVIDSGDADYNTLQAYDFVAASEDGALAATVINELITNGKLVWLLNNAASPLGGEWTSSSAITAYRGLKVEQNQVFLDGLRSDLSFTVQTSGTARAIRSGYPAGWTVLARNTSNVDHKTLLYREHGSGGKGLIYTYDPSQTSETGKNLYDLMYEWLEGVPAHEGKTVPEGHVAFVISRYDDSMNADLTTEEDALYNKLLGYGYEVTFVRFSRLKHSDLSGAAMVAAATYPSLDAGSIGEYLSSGINVFMVYSAASTLGGEWSASSAITAYRRLFVIDNKKFLSTHDKEEVITVQTSGTAYSIVSDYPSGWEVLGRNTSGSHRMTAFSYNGTGGKGAIFTYQPANLSTEGDEVLADIVTWLLQEPTSASPPAAELPDDFELRQNYPNPFNPVTTISYALPVEQNVTLEVFNIQGQRVTTLVNEQQKAGWHEIAFDASRLASGVYIYRLQTGSFVEIKKMMLMK